MIPPRLEIFFVSTLDFLLFFFCFCSSSPFYFIPFYQLHFFFWRRCRRRGATICRLTMKWEKFFVAFFLLWHCDDNWRKGIQIMLLKLLYSKYITSWLELWSHGLNFGFVLDWKDVFGMNGLDLTFCVSWTFVFYEFLWFCDCRHLAVVSISIYICRNWLKKSRKISILIFHLSRNLI